MDPINDRVADMLLPQTTATHWLPSEANFVATVQLDDTPPQQPKVSAYSDLQNQHLQFESGSVLRWTYFIYLCHARGPVTGRPATHDI